MSPNILYLFPQTPTNSTARQILMSDGLLRLYAFEANLNWNDLLPGNRFSFSFLVNKGDRLFLLPLTMVLSYFQNKDAGISG